MTYERKNETRIYKKNKNLRTRSNSKFYNSNSNICKRDGKGVDAQSSV
jgi:hypothetical protein